MDESMRKFQQTVPQRTDRVEVMEVNIRDLGNTVEFEFLFAASVDEAKIDNLWADDESTVKKTIVSKLHEKGWISGYGMNAVVHASDSKRSSLGGKRWEFLYVWENPDMSSTED